MVKDMAPLVSRIMQVLTLLKILLGSFSLGKMAYNGSFLLFLFPFAQYNLLHSVFSVLSSSAALGHLMGREISPSAEAFELFLLSLLLLLGERNSAH